MGCCGCSLSASALTAVVFGLVESIIGMCWNILVIVLVETTKRNDTETMTTIEDLDYAPLYTSTEDVDVPGTEALISFSGGGGIFNGSWEDFKTTLTSDKARNVAHIFELCIAALVVNSFWLITTLALAVGNAEKCRAMLKPWIFSTAIITILDIAATVYFIFRSVESTDGDLTAIPSLFVHNIFVILATFFSRGGPIIWIINVALCIYVAQRIKEIELLKKKRLPFDSDMRIGAFALPHPYETYDADSYRCEKVHRPNTPPPDYEAFQYRHSGGGGGGHRKGNYRKRSLPSDGDNSTLPVSLRSGSSMPRPASTCYAFDDDRVELHHRSSLGLYHHGYDNKGMQLEQTEGWIGIPRPKLTIMR